MLSQAHTYHWITMCNTCTLKKMSLCIPETKWKLQVIKTTSDDQTNFTIIKFMTSGDNETKMDTRGGSADPLIVRSKVGIHQTDISILLEDPG